MRTAIRRAAAIGSVTLLIACAPPRALRIDDALASMARPELVAADSMRDFDRLAEASERLSDAVSQAPVDSDDLETIMVVGSRIEATDLITNNQVGGIDEGDIVKKSGDFLIVLRAGVLRVITTRIGASDTLAQVDRLALIEPVDDDIWYDELLVHGEIVLVLGFNYVEDVSELFVLSLSPEGKLARRQRLRIRSDDYYSSNNYGTRLVDDDLLLFMNVALDKREGNRWPTWSADGSAWTSLIQPDEVFLPIVPMFAPHVHVVVRCPVRGLVEGRFNCQSTGVVASGSPELYVTDRYAYIATTEWDEEAFHSEAMSSAFGPGYAYGDLVSKRHTVIYRIPVISAGPPTAARVEGVSGDQFSFREIGDSLFAATTQSLDESSAVVALSRIEAGDFGSSARKQLTTVARVEVPFHDPTMRIEPERLYIGRHRYSFREESDQEGGPSTVYALPLSGGPPTTLALSHSSDRFESVFDRLIVSGMARGRWLLSTIDRGGARLSSSLDVDGYSSSDDRSHAFNATRLSTGEVVFGLPGVERSGFDRIGDTTDHEVVSDLLFFRSEGASVARAGELVMTDSSPPTDCEDACDDWYGNARLFFVGDRVFGLSGDRLKEGRFERGMIREVRAAKLD